jgi:hypothetical protein
MNSVGIIILKCIGCQKDETSLGRYVELMRKSIVVGDDHK